MHVKQGLIVSVYVDDFKWAGRARMWKKLMKFVDPGEPTSFLDHASLGCIQLECKPSEFFSWREQKDVRITLLEQLRNRLGGRTVGECPKYVHRMSKNLY